MLLKSFFQRLLVMYSTISATLAVTILCIQKPLPILPILSPLYDPLHRPIQPPLLPTPPRPIQPRSFHPTRQHPNPNAPLRSPLQRSLNHGLPSRPSRTRRLPSLLQLRQFIESAILRFGDGLQEAIVHVYC